jgi:quercetin dioxygenase-like cupin family protein
MPVEARFGGPPLHTHELWDEGFYVLEGEVTIQAGDDVVKATPGTFAFAPRGVARTFSNRTDTDARILVLFTPAGFERYLAGEIAREQVPDLIAQRARR